MSTSDRHNEDGQTQIIEAILKWDKIKHDEEDVDQLFNSKESLLQERGVLKSMVSKLQEECVLVAEKLNTLSINHASLMPVIETKNSLSKEVTSLKTEVASLKMNYEKELTDVKNKAESEQEQINQMLQDAKKEHQANVAKLVEHHEELIKIEQSSSETLKAQIDSLHSKHSEELQALKMEHHAELEKYRRQNSKLQKSLLMKTTSNVDLYAAKLQASRSDFEKQIKNKDIQLAELQDELMKTHDSLKHLKLLSVVRGVSTGTDYKETTKTVMRTNTNSTSKKRKLFSENNNLC